MPTKHSVFNYDSLVHATAGATGSIIAMSLIYPLDNIKLRKQLQDEVLANKTTWEAILYILKEEGLSSLYRGITPVLTSLGISNFVYFYSFHGLKSLQSSGHNKSTATTDLIISIVAGVINVFLTNPLWVVNSRLKIAATTTQPRNYSGLMDGLWYIATTEGVSALWSSLGPSLLLVSNPAIHFTVYEMLKRRVPLAKSATAFFVMGAIAKAVATIVTYPVQLAQSRQRYGSAKSSAAVLLCAILRKHGPLALFQGLEAKLMQTVFAAALMFMMYEKIARYVFMLMLRNNKKA